MVEKKVEVVEPEFVPVHDAILPYPFKGIKWALPNVSDNFETSNASIARIFEVAGQYLQAMSVRHDCFTPQPPSLDLVKDHHNMFVRLMGLINTHTKLDNQSRLVSAHVTHERRAFKLYPVRYFDVKNIYCKRWIELYLQALGNMAQMSENGWPNDFSDSTAQEMKKLPREAYRLMCVELFKVPVETAVNIFNEENPFFLEQANFENYDTSHISEIEWIQQPPLGSVYTEDELRAITTPTVPVSPGVPENVEETPERKKERRALNGETVK